MDTKYYIDKASNTFFKCDIIYKTKTLYIFSEEEEMWLAFHPFKTEDEYISRVLTQIPRKQFEKYLLGLELIK